MVKMTSSHRIYPVFLAHAGCPFQCVYCNQWAVTSASSHAAPAPNIVSQFLEQFTPLLEAARDKHVPGELAFYGGTFTALPSEVIEEILETVTPWIHAGVFSGVRFSTRPDGISEEICSLLTTYPIETVELGVQSLVDEVLIQSRRGYSVESVERAAKLVRALGWRLGFQLMVGLPGDSPVRFLDSIGRTVQLRPDFVRIYPTVVLTGTLLAEWHRQGSYSPLSLEEALALCVPAYEAFFQAQIPIVRLGLHPDPELQKAGTIIAGPFHPAFGYLVRVRWWRQRVDRQFQDHHDLAPGRELTLRVADRSLSEVIGPGKSNIRHWLEKWHFRDVKVKGGTDQLPGKFDYFLN
ncbi:MAG TPA: radical SAM protein [Desulfomonilaceae bacterium]|nr:radical SAM protein [Desulfomonilaceae bacterium]